VFIALGQLLFHPFVAGFMLAAILAAIMSTISSQLLVSSSALVEDLYHAFNRKELGEKQRSVMLGRVAVMLVSVVAAIMAWYADNSILALVAFAWAGFGSSFGPVVLLALYWRRLTRWGALAGMATGAVVAAVWANLSGGIFDLYELLPGFVLNLIVTVVVSLNTKVAPGVDEEFDKAVSFVANFRKGELATPED
jgi:SSS family proline:sodium (Na+) symporter opuE